MPNWKSHTIGWWRISITFPKVMKGKYEILIFQPHFNDVSTCGVYIDGVSTGLFYQGSGPVNDGTEAGLQKVAEVYFPTTTEHTITLRNISVGHLFWDYVLFEPVE